MAGRSSGVGTIFTLVSFASSSSSACHVPCKLAKCCGTRPAHVKPTVARRTMVLLPHRDLTKFFKYVAADSFVGNALAGQAPAMAAISCWQKPTSSSRALRAAVAASREAADVVAQVSPAVSTPC